MSGLADTMERSLVFVTYLRDSLNGTSSIIQNERELKEGYDYLWREAVCSSLNPTTSIQLRTEVDLRRLSLLLNWKDLGEMKQYRTQYAAYREERQNFASESAQAEGQRESEAGTEPQELEGSEISGTTPLSVASTSNRQETVDGPCIPDFCKHKGQTNNARPTLTAELKFDPDPNGLKSSKAKTHIRREAVYQELFYLGITSRYYGARLGLAVVNEEFVRMVVLDDQTIAIECTTQGLTTLKEVFARTPTDPGPRDTASQHSTLSETISARPLLKVEDIERMDEVFKFPNTLWSERDASDTDTASDIPIGALDEEGQRRMILFVMSAFYMADKKDVAANDPGFLIPLFTPVRDISSHAHEDALSTDDFWFVHLQTGVEAFAAAGVNRVRYKAKQSGRHKAGIRPTKKAKNDVKDPSLPDAGDDDDADDDDDDEDDAGDGGAGDRGGQDHTAHDADADERRSSGGRSGDKGQGSDTQRSIGGSKRKKCAVSADESHEQNEAPHRPDHVDTDTQDGEQLLSRANMLRAGMTQPGDDHSVLQEYLRDIKNSVDLVNDLPSNLPQIPSLASSRSSELASVGGDPENDDWAQSPPSYHWARLAAMALHYDIVFVSVTEMDYLVDRVRDIDHSVEIDAQIQTPDSTHAPADPLDPSLSESAERCVKR
ncbi:hypothetical protein IAU59_007599 [Kwoniella sp. CBS 9459]